MSVLNNLKKSFNPSNLHGVWSHGAASSVFKEAPGTLVIAKDGHIPFILSKLLSREIRFEGNVQIAEDVTIRRKSFVSGTAQHPSILKSKSMVMDYCEIEGSVLEEGAGFAHGGISKYATWGAWSFANIEPILNGTPDARITVQPGAYIGPGVNVPKGAEIHANNYYIGNPVKIFPTVLLDQTTLEPLQGWDAYYAGTAGKNGSKDIVFRPITLSDEQLDVIDAQTAKLATLDKGSEEYEAIKDTLVTTLKRVWRLGSRPRHLPPFSNQDVTTLIEIGAKQWIKDQNRSLFHSPTLSNWLWFYHQTQHLKQVSYQQEAAKQFGDIVWHNAPLQSEILHLDRAHRILVATGNHDTQDLQNLIKAKLFLLGAYEPKANEDAALNNAFLNANAIIADTQSALNTITHDVNLIVHRNAIIDQALKPVNIADSVSFVATAQERALLSERLGQFAALYQHVPEAAKVIKVKEDPNRILSEREVPSWIQVLNPKRTNFVTLADGPKVRSFAGHVPVVYDGATLVGNVDLSGAVHIGFDVTVINGSLASEQSAAPFTAYGHVILDNVIGHTATKERHPALIDGRVAPIIIKDSHLHGAEVEGSTFAEKTLLSDEGVIRGVVANGAMNIGQSFVRDSNSIVFEGGSPSNDAFSKGDAAAYKAWWDQSEFKGLPFEQDAVKRKIVEIYGERRADAKAALAEKTDKYGPLYNVSAQLQAAVLNLKNGVHILRALGDVRNAEELSLYMEGIQYQIGDRDTLSVGASERLEAKGQLTRASNALSAIAERGKVFEVPNWEESQSPYAYSHEDGLKLAKSTHRPVTANAQRNFDLADHPLVTGEHYAGIKHAMTSEDAPRRGLRKTVEFHPEHIKLIVEQINHVQGIISALRAEALSKPQLTAQNRSGVAAPRLTV
ncbi:MAG: hypothetical protein SFW65_01335 [Alphaproteobacteria bacterium]|nr:hypothetical protein [Alphaproteobacteria bacterium]